MVPVGFGAGGTTRMNRVRQTWAGLAVWLVAAAVTGAATAAGPPPTTQASKVDPSAIATQAGSVAITLRQIETDASADRTSARIKDGLPDLSAEIDARLVETSNLLASSPALQVLDGLSADWQTIQKELDGWDHALAHRRDELKEVVRTVPVDRNYDPVVRGDVPGRLQALSDPWAQSRDVFEFYADHPRSDEMRDRMFEAEGVADGVIQSVGGVREDILSQLSATYGISHDVDLQRAKVADVVFNVREARDQAWGRLFQRDGEPVWSPLAWRRAAVKGGAPGGGMGTFGSQVRGVQAYVARRQVNVGLHVGLIAVLAAALTVGRRWVRRWAEADPSLNRAMLAFTAPIATALVLSFLAAVWIYPQAPRLFWAGLGAAALVPTVFLLRRVVQPRLFLILDALVVFYFVDQVRMVAASVPALGRGLFLAEMLGGCVTLGLLVRARWDVVPTDAMGWVVRVGLRVWLAVFAGCLLTDAVGNVSLAELVGGAALGGGYLAVILYACTRVVGGLAVIFLRSRPLTLLNGVRRHQPLLLSRVTAGVDWVAAALWGLAVLEMLSARPAVFQGLTWFWGLPVHLGAIRFTPSHVLVFGLTVWASFWVSRFVQFVLNEDVYGHLRLATGMSYAANRLVHYSVVVAGFYLAMGAAGVPFTELSLVVTALTVGLGFGLQNVVNNFVSGLILLFERPIKVGDLIQMSDATTGVVEYIGIRASIIRGTDSSQVIVPNGNLISNQLTNWTLTNRQRGLMIPMSLGADADPARVMGLLTGVAAAHPRIVRSPAPEALLTKFAADAFSYELRVWTDTADQWVQIRSDLSVSLHAMLVREGIGIK